jgi:predicted nucleic acid-binding protein
VANFVAVYDACVLYPAPLRDLLLWLALTDLYRAKWSTDIHEEWIRNVLKERPELKVKLARTRELMDCHARDCLVDGYKELIPGLTLPDPDDRHVLAAAIRSGAAVIVTFNLKDFPASALTPYGIEAQHPDDFIAHLLDLAPGLVCGAVKRHRASLKNPQKTIVEYLDTLSKQSLPQTASTLRDFAQLL